MTVYEYPRNLHAPRYHARTNNVNETLCFRATFEHDCRWAKMSRRPIGSSDGQNRLAHYGMSVAFTMNCNRVTHGWAQNELMHNTYSKMQMQLRVRCGSVCFFNYRNGECTIRSELLGLSPFHLIFKLQSAITNNKHMYHADFSIRHDSEVCM